MPMVQWVIRSFPRSELNDIFLDQANAQQRRWYILSCLWNSAYKKIGKSGLRGAISLSEWSFTICPLHVRRHITVNKMY